MSHEARLKALAVDLPPVPVAAGLYAPCVRSGNQLFVSGQVPVKDGVPMRKGKLGDGVTIEEAAGLARQCALQAVAIVRNELGTLDKVTRVIRVGGFVASAEGFIDHPKVVNGASQLLLDLFGEAGRHARVAVGLAELPFGVPVEVEFLFEVS